jgi:hypothetical protein
MEKEDWAHPGAQRLHTLAFLAGGFQIIDCDHAGCDWFRFAGKSFFGKRLGFALAMTQARESNR